MTDNIIKFPKKYNGKKLPKVVNINPTSASEDLDFADNLAEGLMIGLIHNIGENGIDIKNERFIVSGANLKYRDCFDRIAVALGKRKATIKVTPFLKEIAWRVQAIRYLITGKAPLITKETANTSMIRRSFSNAKIEKKND